eukprot:TRINITY_DN1759_c0_g1_i6.p1 TRINITY_DN1759_c0_g1~~TRINITY_DN1759_c0_g1_i6.p1  ORF type:complete len:481 (+),score=149.76 TRINITY_DN1759_c0_g1_i6:212-1654(+)
MAAAAAPMAAAATQDDEELEFTPGQRVSILSPPALAGKQGTIVGPALGEAFAVRLESGSIFNIATASIQDAAAPAPIPAAAPAAAPAVAAPAAAPMAAAAPQDDELEFTPGQRVTILAPPALAGRPGTIVGPALGESFAVQLESGSIFNIATQNIQDAAAPAPAQVSKAATPAPMAVAATQDDEELEFTPGQLVTILAPPAMAGRRGTIVGPALGESFAVQLESGSIFNIATQNIQDAAAPAPAQVSIPAAAPMAAAASTAVAAPQDDELEFTPGQQVTILAPPAMAGRQGTIVGPALGESFAVRLLSGSIFNIATENIQDAAAPAPPSVSTAAAAVPIAASAAPMAAAAKQDDEELEFTPGQQVAILGPPAMAGRRGTIVGPALGESFAVRLESGSIFHIATVNIQDAAEPAPPQVSTAAAAPTTAAAAPTAVAATHDDEELEFAPGQRVTILAPPAMAGRQGTIVGPALGESFAVQLA